MEVTLQADCKNNIGGLQRLTLFRAPEIASINGGTIQMSPGSTVTQITFVANGADYQELMRESEHGPFNETAISASLGADNPALIAWCTQNKRRKFVAILESQNDLARLVGSKDLPLTLSYAHSTGMSDGDKNNRQLMLKGRTADLGSAGFVIPDDPDGFFLVTEDVLEFIVTDEGDKILYQ